LPNQYGDKLSQAFEKSGQLCVGIDPHSHLLRTWGLNDSALGLREFALRVVEAASGLVSAVKPQVSFFERFGARGFEVLAEVTQFAHSEGLIVIVDAKRGDIGTTMEAYFEAWFGEHSGFYADAITTSPYLGLGATTRAFSKWAEEGKGFYSLVATSNVEGEAVQLAQTNGRTLAADQFEQLIQLNQGAQGPIGSFGAVLGATVDLESFGVGERHGKGPVLAPGFGAQGAKLTDAKAIFGGMSGAVSYSVSRSILEAGANDLPSAIKRANSELTDGLTK
jgi:orotidine-5'-phosphate decarboxylase